MRIKYKEIKYKLIDSFNEITYLKKILNEIN